MGIRREFVFCRKRRARDLDAAIGKMISYG